MNNTAIINGLVDGISVVESDNKNQQPSFQSDILYCDKELFDPDLEALYYNEGFTVSKYQVTDFGESVTLLSTVTTEEIFKKGC